MKYLRSVRENFNTPKFPVFTLQDLKTYLQNQKITPSYLKRMINHLIKKKEITRITKGVYTFRNDITTVGFAYKPFYYGLENALTIRKIWNQNTNPTIITSKNVRTGQRKFQNTIYIIKHLNKKQFFGYDLIQQKDYWIPVSNPEKTLIDMTHFKHHVPEEALTEIKKQINRKKLKQYLQQYDKQTQKTLQTIK